MSSLDHVISGAALSFSLEQELQTVREQLVSAGERVGRTLVKNGPLRVTLIGLKPGGVLRPHKAGGPITVQVLEGSDRVRGWWADVAAHQRNAVLARTPDHAQRVGGWRRHLPPDRGLAAA